MKNKELFNHFQIVLNSLESLPKDELSKRFIHDFHNMSPNWWRVCGNLPQKSIIALLTNCSSKHCFNCIFRNYEEKDEHICLFYNLRKKGTDKFTETVQNNIKRLKGRD